MNWKPLLALPMVLASALPSMAYGPAYGTGGSRCYRNVWREEYVPGTYGRRGYVRRWEERVSIPCGRGRGHRPHYQPTYHPRPVTQTHHNEDNNSCIEGAILGGLLGGGIGGAISRGDGRYVGIPGGVVAGALIGCQLDGG